MNINHGVRNSIYCTLRHEPLSCSAPQRTESRAPCRGRGGLTKTPMKRVHAERRYSCYNEIRHNSRTYKVEIEERDSSTASE
jgi:hypothetical protein